MAIYALPLSSRLPWYTFRTVFAGITYTLEMRYNLRMQRWVLQVQDAIGRPVLCGIPLLPRQDLLAGYHTLAVPPGALVVYNATNTPLPAGLQAFIADYSLLYVDPAP